jgi:hypothetical protein
MQGAGNQLEEKVRILGETTAAAQLEQEDKLQKCTEQLQELDNNV